jgi:hypothetical protein
LIFKLKEFAADKEKLKIVQPACRPACRQAGPKGSLPPLRQGYKKKIKPGGKGSPTDFK